MCVMDSPTQKVGYLDVKQSAKVKGRKLKTWKRKWVVLTKMTDMSSDQIVAKIDLYENETVWLTNRSEKTTFVLDHVTSIQRARSKTHPHAFEVAQRHPELVFSGNSEIDSFGWILTLQEIFTPHLVEMRKDSYHVTIQANADAKRWNLSGDYGLAVSSACLSLNNLQTGKSLISWGLSTLMRFNVTKDGLNRETDVLVIECGKNGPTGESTFGFISKEASDILKGIRHSICLALAQRQTARKVNFVPRDRSISESNSEKQFQNILDSSPFYTDLTTRERSGSESSGCTLTPVSPHPSTIGIDNPLLSSPDICHGLPSRRSNTELASLNESDEHECENNLEQSGTMPPTLKNDKMENTLHHHCRHLSLPVKVRSKGDDPGYSVIKDVNNSTDVESRSRRNTIATGDATQESSSTTSEEPPLRPPPRRRRNNTINISPKKRGVSFDKDEDDRSDVDSAISSSILSSSYDSAKLRAENLINIEKSLAPANGAEDSDFGSPGSPAAGYLDRRRSSSTPDLAAFWKHQANLENVYEELDSIRAATPRNLPSSPTDIPPALPARPFNLISPTFRNRDKNNQTVVRLKKSFFFNKNNNKMQREKSMISVGGEARPCFCNYPYISTNGFLLSSGNDSVCGQCGGSMTTKTYEEINKKPEAKSNAVSSSNSSSSDIYASISDVKEKSSKRRRSSEITRPTFVNYLGDNQNQILERDPAKFYSLRRRNLQNSRKFQDLMKNGSEETIGDFRHMGASRLSTSSKDDPLISFFVDDDNFESNPMVTGRLAGSQNLQPPTEDLLISPDSPAALTNKEYFTEDIFTMEPEGLEDQNQNAIDKSKNGLFHAHNSSPCSSDATLFDPFSGESDMNLLSGPVTYTCLQNPAATSSPFNTVPSSSSNHQNWSNVDPFELNSDISLNSCHNIFTPSPLSPLSSVQFPLQTNMNKMPTSQNESLYLSMQETKGNETIFSTHTLKSVSNPNKVSQNGTRGNFPSFEDSQQVDLFRTTSQTSTNTNEWFPFGDENSTPQYLPQYNLNRQASVVSEDVYVCPGLQPQ